MAEYTIASEALGAVLPSKKEHASLGHGLQRVLDEYADAMRQPFAGHDLANFIRNDLKELVLAQLGFPAGSFIVKGSCGQGVWARGPWIGIFDPIITSSAQSGYYGCFLFREDMEGVYLTLTQAVTEVKLAYRADTRATLAARASHFRAVLGGDRRRFIIDSIDLAPSKRSNDTSFYECGTVCATYYPKGKIPPDETLRQDLADLLSLYENLASSGAVTTVTSESGQPFESSKEFEDASRMRLHKRIERNKRLVDKVKAVHGHICEACGMDFKDIYGDLGDGYIEAHHLRPLSTLAKAKLEMDPLNDFVVLCANCHRMIHRSEHVSNLEDFKAAHLRQRNWMRQVSVATKHAD